MRLWVAQNASRQLLEYWSGQSIADANTLIEVIDREAVNLFLLLKRPLFRPPIEE